MSYLIQAYNLRKKGEFDSPDFDPYTKRKLADVNFAGHKYLIPFEEFLESRFPFTSKHHNYRCYSASFIKRLAEMNFEDSDEQFTYFKWFIEAINKKILPSTRYIVIVFI